MTIIQWLLRMLDLPMTQPEPYGWFHMLSLLLTVGLTVYLCVCCRKWSPEQIRRLMLITAVTVALLEIYKQINFGFSYTDGITFDYAWYAFPFQFCSTPMYVGLLAGLTKEGAVHRAACAYLASYALFAGICVMLYPNTVFVRTIGINIQTMICHGSMIVIGVYLLCSGYVKAEHKTILGAMPVFGICVLMAAGMNEIAYRTGLLETDTFDMFFISPYTEPSLPVYSMVQKAVPFPWCLILYILGFSLAAYLILLIAIGVTHFIKKRRQAAIKVATK